jgi:hypothetical protein
MKKNLYLILFVLFPAVVFAQNRTSVKGQIIDSASKAPIERATVAIVSAKDTTLISYTLTQKNGNFNLSGIPTGIDTRLIVSAMSYNTFRKTLTFKPGENKSIGSIFLNTRSLQEIVIKGERSPIVIKKDTLEFNTEAFKTRPNAAVEDLLKLLPGVQVNMDGTILINGKTVSKVLIDGKRFFGSDPTIATKNLDAELVDKVQVYDDRDEDPDHKLTERQVGKIINLKMKSKIKKSTIGKIYGGEGTRGRYEGGGIISNFRDTLQVSAIGLTNNLTRTGFSSSELSGMGGFNRSGGAAQYDGTFGGNGDGGIERMRSGGVNINNDYGKKLKINLMYFYYNYVKDYNSKSLNQQKLGDTLLTTQNANTYQLRQRRHTVSTLIEMQPDTSHRIRFDARLDISPTSSNGDGITNTFNSLTPKLTDLLNKTSSNSLANEFSDNFMYYQKLKKQGASLTIGQSFSSNRSNSDDYNYNNLTSFTPDINPSLLDRYANSVNTYYTASVYATYNTPFSKKVSNELFLNSRYYYTANKLSTYDNTPTGSYDSFLADQSSDLARSHYIQNIKNTLSYNITSNLTLKAGLDLEIQSLTNNFNSIAPNSYQHYVYLFPLIKLNGQKFDLSYYESANPPSLNQIQPITKQISPVETLSGNPNLTPSRLHALDFSYYTNNNDKQTYTSIWGSAKLTSNNIVQVSTKDANGFVTSTYTNKNGGWNANAGIAKGKQFKRSKIWHFSLNSAVYANYDQRSFFFNGDGGTQYDYVLTGAQNVGINYRSIVDANVTYYLSNDITKYRGVDYPSVSSLRHTLSSNATINLSKRFIFDMQYQYRYNPQIPAGFSRSSNVLNLAATLMMFKQNKGQIKASVYDIFDQNTSTYRYAANNSITSGENQILRRYFLLTYQYKISTIKK